MIKTIFWHKRSKFEKVFAGFILAHHQYRASDEAKSEYIFSGCIIEEGIDYHGHDIPYKTKATGNQEECAAYCASIPGGLFWTWNKHNKNCYVKNSKSGKTPHGSSVSGNIECAKKAAPVYKPGIADFSWS